jgi:ankyrin repeat protein
MHYRTNAAHDCATPLHQALLQAMESDDPSERAALVEAVLGLLEAGLDPNAATVDGTTPLVLAVALDSERVLERMLAAGATCRGRPADSPIAAPLPLVLAAALGKAPTVAALLRAGFDPLVADRHRRTAFLAALDGHHDEIALTLGLLPTVRDQPQGSPPRTPLAWAAGRGRIGLVRALVAGGADPNLRRPLSALAVAYVEQQAESVRALLDLGAREEGTLGAVFDADPGPARVVNVVTNTAADGAGLQPGDQVVEVGGNAIESLAALRSALEAHFAGEHVRLRWLRQGVPMSGHVELRPLLAGPLKFDGVQDAGR